MGRPPSQKSFTRLEEYAEYLAELKGCYNINVIILIVNSNEIGLLLTRSRRQAGLTQAQVADRMGIPQSAISRAEAGKVTPSISFIERYVRATGQPVTLEIRPSRRPLSRKDRRNRVRAATNNYVFNPWERNPSELEARSLAARGLTRDHFEGKATPKTRSRS